MTTLIDVLALALELVLSTTLLVAAGQKIFDGAGWRAARLEVIEHMPGVIWNAVPAVEAAVAIALGVGLRPLAGAAATALFITFGLVLSVAYRNGARGDCNCFGSVLPTKIGPIATMRATALALAALVLVLVGDPSMPGHPLALAIPLAAAAVTSVFASLRPLLSS